MIHADHAGTGRARAAFSDDVSRRTGWPLTLLGLAASFASSGCTGEASSTPTPSTAAASGAHEPVDAPVASTSTTSSASAAPETSASGAPSNEAPPTKVGDRRTRGADGARMVFVPAGPFLYGSPKDVGDADEFPQRTITVDAFLIDELETTRAQYARCVEAGGCKAPVAEDAAATKACNWPDATRDAHPINCVTYADAVDYCRWAGARLPTEAEWEKAARGDDGRAYPWGNAAPTCELGIMPTPAGQTGCGAKTTGPVGSKPAGASPYGALDMSGNVWEWVADFYAEDHYASASAKNPKGPARGHARGLRGGAWEVHDMLHLRAANRYRFAPTMRFHALGIRCAADP